VKEKIQIIKDAAESPQKQVEKTQPRLDNSKAAGIIGRLQGQVKSLQEEIDALKTKEQIFLDQNKAKVRKEGFQYFLKIIFFRFKQTGEVVARWEERKRLQGKCSKLKIKLEESEANAKKLKESNLALRTLIERLEREKILLDQQLRRKTKAPPEPQRYQIKINPYFLSLQENIFPLNKLNEMMENLDIFVPDLLPLMCSWPKLGQSWPLRRRKAPVCGGRWSTTNAWPTTCRG